MGRIWAERFFAGLTSKRIRHGSYCGVDDLKTAIHDYLLHHNAKPTPFTWTRGTGNILARQRRALDTPEEIRGNWWEATDSELKVLHSGISQRPSPNGAVHGKINPAEV